jgi:hypothetical protein
MMRRTLSLVGTALAVFHVWLFAGQVWSGALADPNLILRWLIAAGLIGGLVILRRQGESIIFGRKAIAIWVLAALLHGPAFATRFEAPGIAPIPEVVTTLTQVVVGLIGLIGLGLVLAGARSPRPAFAASGRTAIRVCVPALSPSVGLAFAPRPPPLAR